MLFEAKRNSNPGQVDSYSHPANFIKQHRTLRVSPAMAAGVTDKLWDVSDLVDLWEAEERAERAVA